MTMDELKMLVSALSLGIELAKDAQQIIDSEPVKDVENIVSRLIDWVERHHKTGAPAGTLGIAPEMGETSLNDDEKTN
jgi:hypothetical protein